MQNLKHLINTKPSMAVEALTQLHTDLSRVQALASLFIDFMDDFNSGHSATVIETILNQAKLALQHCDEYEVLLNTQKALDGRVAPAIQ